MALLKDQSGSLGNKSRPCQAELRVGLCWFRLKAGTDIYKAWNRFSVTSAAVTKKPTGQNQPGVLSGGKETFPTYFINITLPKIME